MMLEGFDSLKRHVPAFRTLGGVLSYGLEILGVFLFTGLFFLAADRYFAEWMPDGEIVILALGFLLLSRFYSQRKRYLKEYGATAYGRALVRFGIPGLGIITASIAHLAYISGPGLPDLWWKSWLVAVGYLLVLAGLLLWFRAVTATGIDSLAALYVYFPAEGKRLQGGLYSLIRHPIYAAAQQIGFGLALIHANWYALLVAVMMPLFFLGWIRLVEEPELLERFPEYKEYRAQTPAFSPIPSNLVSFWRLLLTGRISGRD